MPDWGKAITVYYASVAGLRAVLERSDCWTLCWTHQVSYGAALGSGLCLGDPFVSLHPTAYILDPALSLF